MSSKNKRTVCIQNARLKFRVASKLPYFIKNIDMGLVQISYSESATNYDSPFMEDVIILTTPDNLWLYTENDNLFVSEEWDPLVIY